MTAAHPARRNRAQTLHLRLVTRRDRFDTRAGALSEIIVAASGGPSARGFSWAEVLGEARAGRRSRADERR